MLVLLVLWLDLEGMRMDRVLMSSKIPATSSGSCMHGCAEW